MEENERNRSGPEIDNIEWDLIWQHPQLPATCAWSPVLTSLLRLAEKLEDQVELIAVIDAEYDDSYPVLWCDNCEQDTAHHERRCVICGGRDNGKTTGTKRTA